MKFVPSKENLDFDLSPYTGLTRNSWIEAAKYVIDGVFQHIKDFQDPVVIPRIETEISYPHKNSTGGTLEAEKKAEMFEGLTRSFFIAAPLIQNEPDIRSNGHLLRDYYKNQILRSVTKEDEYCVGTYEELQKMVGQKDPFRAFQQTVETCALVICLWITEKEIWDNCNKEEQDKIAKFLHGFGHANTVPQNWRLFNMLDLAFLHMHGYEIDVNVMRDHAQAILAYSVGDGWYRDGQSFDYYSCWAFNVYAPLWNKWYGYDNEPELAARFEAASNELMKTYGRFFDADGYTNMWGRSNIYRNAATSAFDGNMFLNNSMADPGLARRISSGSLMQFLGREDTFVNGVPTLGFYKQFAPLVQGYSCAESPFWFGKAFLCLHLPEDHPFWTAKENNGVWDDMQMGDVTETVLNGPALCATNHKANGETVLRSGKIVKNVNDEHGMWNYSKLCFNTKYPWESAPKFTNDKFKTGEIESQQYVLVDRTSGNASKANVTFWHGAKEGVLYRRQYFGYNLQDECHWIQAVNLADFPVSEGIIRVDKHRLFRRPVTFTLGSYGFPDNGTNITRYERDGAKAIVLSGHDSQGNPKQMAMTVYNGFTDIDIVHSTGTNPDSENSIVIYGIADFNNQYDSSESYIMVSQVLTRDTEVPFTEDDVFMIKKITNSDKAATGSYGDTVVELKNSTKVINFEQIESQLML